MQSLIQLQTAPYAQPEQHHHLCAYCRVLHAISVFVLVGSRSFHQNKYKLNIHSFKILYL